MIMTQNQILLAEARFGFRYASDRVPKQGTQSGASYFALNCRAPAKVVLGCRNALVMGRNSTEIAHPQRLSSTSD
jgi:hypothetical protein